MSQLTRNGVSRPQHVLSAAWEQSIIGYDAPAAAATCRAPLCYIGAATNLSRT